MDDRGRLAQSLKRKDRQNLRERMRTLSTKFGRLRRLTGHWLAPLIEMNPPRGAGAFAAVALVAGSAWYGAVRGEHVAEMTAQLRDVCNNLATAAGMQVGAITLTDNTQLSREEILALAGISSRSALPCLDVAAARSNLLANPWIAEATVLKLYPGGVRIDITERAAAALWQKDGAVSVIAADGTVLEPFTGGRFASLPLVVGQGADRAASTMLATIGNYASIRSEVAALVLVAERRWNIRLRNGIDVRLPEGDVDDALQSLVKLDQDQKILSRDIALIDLRLADRVTVRLSDGAATAREEALKEQLKKTKKKGGAA